MVSPVSRFKIRARGLAIAAAAASVYLLGSFVAALAENDTRAAKTDSGSILVGSKTIKIGIANVNKLKKLKSLGVTVVYPKYTPARFTLSSIKLTNDSGNKAYPDYELKFCDKKHLCYSIETAYSGIGDGPDGDSKVRGKSKVFGQFAIDVFKPHSEGNDTNLVYYLSSWMMDSKRIVALKKQVEPYEGRFYHFLGHGVTDAEAVKIVESLRIIK